MPPPDAQHIRDFPGGEPPIASPLAGAPGFVKAAFAAPPAVSPPKAGPLASVAEHSNAAAALARENGLASVHGSAAAAAAAWDGSGGDGSISAAQASALALSPAEQRAVAEHQAAVVAVQAAARRVAEQNAAAEAAAAGGGLAGRAPPALQLKQSSPPDMQLGTASATGGPPPLSRYSMLAALAPGGVDRTDGAGPPTLERDSMQVIHWTERSRPLATPNLVRLHHGRGSRPCRDAQHPLWVAVVLVDRSAVGLRKAGQLLKRPARPSGHGVNNQC